MRNMLGLASKQCPGGGGSCRLGRVVVSKKPYFQDDAVTIYHGDCRDILPTLEPVDLVLTDPPYGIGEAAGKNKSRGLLATSRDFGDAAWDNKPIDASLLALVCAGGQVQVVFGGNYYDLPPTSCWLIWDKENGATDFADCEMAWTKDRKSVV